MSSVVTYCNDCDHYMPHKYVSVCEVCGSTNVEVDVDMDELGGDELDGDDMDEMEAYYDK